MTLAGTVFETPSAAALALTPTLTSWARRCIRMPAWVSPEDLASDAVLTLFQTWEQIQIHPVPVGLARLFAYRAMRVAARNYGLRIAATLEDLEFMEVPAPVVEVPLVVRETVTAALDYLPGHARLARFLHYGMAIPGPEARHLLGLGHYGWRMACRGHGSKRGYAGEVFVGLVRSPGTFVFTSLGVTEGATRSQATDLYLESGSDGQLAVVGSDLEVQWFAR